MGNSWAVEQVMEIAAELRQRSKELVEVALELRGDPEEMLPPYDDISEQMPVNPQLQGHNDRHPTTCPGWDAMHWRDRFYEAVSNAA